MTENRITPSRRTVLTAAPLAAVVLGAAACGNDSGGSDNASTAADSSPSDSAANSSSDVLTTTSAVPVGSGVVVDDVVVTQASAGDFAAFSTKCPHQGCAVAPKEGKLDCPCHGSEFDLDGSLVHGPATKGLTPVDVQVRGTDIVRA
ncbi:Rieske (2Fe-2S) protein [Gordonia sp. HY442]|uniref:QcrA and Rieske domain-containing protein n=1 Tax=Gordonia zhenghanii TaxID=2911516 RepID=UPI001F32FB5B|nr:Rieske (2Fe-2S) protein [Gordonia zhenghanii]MCF8607630.1 Rieske (2Fe-2S) protein [Gordonia zhenghanii]